MKPRASDALGVEIGRLAAELWCAGQQPHLLAVIRQDQDARFWLVYAAPHLVVREIHRAKAHLRERGEPVPPSSTNRTRPPFCLTRRNGAASSAGWYDSTFFCRCGSRRAEAAWLVDLARQAVEEGAGVVRRAALT